MEEVNNNEDVEKYFETLANLYNESRKFEKQILLKTIF